MNLEVMELGLISFKDAYLKQRDVHHQIQSGKASHTLIFCQHPPTITLSRKAKLENILIKEPIRQGEIDFIVGVNRGGEVTYHGPGQLMGYLIFDLRKLGRNLSQFLNNMENSVINALRLFNISATTIKGFRGVWVGGQKIASIGIGMEKWISLHGFALNVYTQLRHFSLIRPCGLEVKMTSMKEQLGYDVSINLVKQRLKEQVLKVFRLKNKHFLAVHN